MASGAFVFLIPHHKETSSVFPETQPTLMSCWVRFFFLFPPVTEKPSTKLKHTRGSGENGVDDIVFSDMDARLKDKSVG